MKLLGIHITLLLYEQLGSAEPQKFLYSETFEKFLYSETLEKETPTGFVRYWEVFAIGRWFKKDCHIWDLTFCPLFMACPLFGMSAIGSFHCIFKIFRAQSYLTVA